MTLELVSMGRRFLGMEEPLATSCTAVQQMDVSMRHVPLLCHRAGTQMYQHQLLVLALSRTSKPPSEQRTTLQH